MRCQAIPLCVQRPMSGVWRGKGIAILLDFVKLFIRVAVKAGPVLYSH